MLSSNLPRPCVDYHYIHPSSRSVRRFRDPPTTAFGLPHSPQTAEINDFWLFGKPERTPSSYWDQCLCWGRSRQDDKTNGLKLPRMHRTSASHQQFPERPFDPLSGPVICPLACLWSISLVPVGPNSVCARTPCCKKQYGHRGTKAATSRRLHPARRSYIKTPPPPMLELGHRVSRAELVPTTPATPIRNTARVRSTMRKLSPDRRHISFSASILSGIPPSAESSEATPRTQ
ncbi:hypothetical protein B0H16DRAFT_1498664 [Mycena metata]|uniref:Uncharacterized protein n=1 Tax=Mycena metata TaxID=1033252 RepID=A0AAD7NYZ8_9AGAR|nr:hypothetical protein B0H16DRAFT_1498664 [Mycena metata]